MNKIKSLSSKIKFRTGLKTISYIIVSILVGFVATYATSKLTPPGPVSNTMYSLEDIWNLSEGNTTDLGEGAIETTPSLSETGKTLTEVYTAISNQLTLLTADKIAKDEEVFGRTGTLYGDTDPAKVLTTATYAGTATAGGSYGLPKTGQTTCYDASGGVITCTGTYQDGDSPHGAPATGARFSLDAVNNIVTDNATGLEWEKCSFGQSGADCATGSATTQTWTTALSTCHEKATDGGGWRLPNINELFSITSREVQAPPAIDHTFFPATQFCKNFLTNNERRTADPG
jgi:hypothetical protein